MKKKILLCCVAVFTLVLTCTGFAQGTGETATDYRMKEVQTHTSSGDIVLYSGSRLVVFHGSNSWAYTRLGHIVDKSPEEMRKLLGQGDVTITISVE